MKPGKKRNPSAIYIICWLCLSSSDVIMNHSNEGIIIMYLSMKTSSFWKALMVTMPAMEEVMWWMTGAFSWLSSRLVSFTPWCIVQSITITTKMMATKARVNQGM